MNRTGKRIYRFRLQDGRSFYALVNTSDMVAISVMEPGFRVNREGRRSLELTA